MSIWKEIRHSINSTLCTSSFLPLDKMIENAKVAISSKIDATQTNVMNAVNNMQTSMTGTGRVVAKQTINPDSNWEGVDIIKFIAPVSGMYKMQAEVTVDIGGMHYFDFYKLIPQKFSYITQVNNNGVNYSKIDGEYRNLSTYAGSRREMGSSEILHSTSIITITSGFQSQNQTETIGGYFLAQAGELVVLNLTNGAYRNGVVPGGLCCSSITTTVTYGNS